MKTVYAFDNDGVYLSPIWLDDSDLSPLENGVYLLPAGTTETAPPAFTAEQFAIFTDGEWVVEDKPAPPEPEPEPVAPPTPLQQIAALEAANPITHRNLRDLSMTVAQIAAAVTGADPMVNPAVQQIAALEAQIAALRAQI